MSDPTALPAPRRLLLLLVGADLASAFTWMTEIVFSDGQRLQCYQHAPTRRFLYATYDRSIVGFTTHDTVHIMDARASIREVIAGWKDLPPEPENSTELPHSYVRFSDAVLDLD